jgi:NAD(P)-dependent dehydrogenase (short-subunit alcohol dehydrogenase family)
MVQDSSAPPCTGSLAPRKIGVLLIHPGWARTRMGGDTAGTTPEDSVARMLALVDGLELSRSGALVRHDAAPLPW